MTKTFFGLIFIVIFFYSCANISAPTGGAKDVTAPAMKHRTVRDSMLNYSGGKIQFEFNEFVQLKDIQNQLVITPLVKTKPKVTTHKKIVTVYLPDSILEKNTTYNISLGTSIQDLHEGNPAQNIGFTFSTGPYFDSLSLKGTVYNAETGKPDTNAWVLLYPSTAKDSTIIKEKPLYVKKVVDGMFQFQNLPNRVFKIFALQDLNSDHKYNTVGEKIAFNNDVINPIDSTTKIKLYTFLEKENIDTSSKNKVRGMMKQASVNSIATSLSYTVSVDTTNKTKRTFNLYDTLKVTFDSHLKVFDITKIRLYQAEILDETAFFELDSTSKIIKIKTDWQQDATYSLKLLKGFAVDSNNLKANASEFVFKTKRESDYGILTIKANADSKNIIQLVMNDKVIQEKRAIDTSTHFKLLLPGNYQVRILHDENRNNKWDTGSLFPARLQPEITEFYPQEITIKANWENKIDLRLSDNKKSRIGVEKK